jgi:AcrR family transcriptional regulator
MKSPRIDVARIRREQIVEAAVAVIAEQGLHNLSLSEIENRAGMSRGQLTYYFPTKEEILLAVFDRLLQLMYQRLGRPGGDPTGGPAAPAPAHAAAAPEGQCPHGEEQAGAWEWTCHLFDALLRRPPVSPEFSVLQYTFLSQLSYREDFRRRLASLYEEWRGNMARGLADDLARGSATRPVPPRAMASLIQALLHGLSMQAAADPGAFDREEMVKLCLDLLGTYMGVRPPPPGGPEAAPAAPPNGKRARRKPGRSPGEEP